MTRIIAGTAKGRTLKVPTTGTRPTSDRVREAMFSSLEHRLGTFAGRCVYDLYAGSGALGFEARSRGATAAVLVEQDRKALDVIRANAASTGLDVEIITADVAKFVQRQHRPLPDVVFVDPPYELPAAAIREQLETLLDHCSDHEVLLVVERSSRDTESPIPHGCTGIDVRTLGETAVIYAHWYGYAHDDS